MDQKQTRTSQTVVLIEDELFILDLYDSVLKKNGFNVLTAMNGDKAIELIYTFSDTNKPNLILLDIMLPKINGLELLKKIKQTTTLKSVPVILLTNLGDRNIVTEAFRAGAQGYLMKMRLTPQKLVDQIQIFLKDPNFIMDFNTIPFDN